MTEKEIFQHNKARKNVVLTGAIILAVITALSAVSSFMIYQGGFADFPAIFRATLAFFAVIVVEGAFAWLLYGVTRAFTSAFERLVGFAGMGFLMFSMLTNMVTHFMMVKRIELSPFQHAWCQWGAVTVFIVVLLVVLLITLGDPAVRNHRAALRYQGERQQVTLRARSEALQHPSLEKAMNEYIDAEAQTLVRQLLPVRSTAPESNAGGINIQASRPAVGFAGGIGATGGNFRVAEPYVFQIRPNGEEVLMGTTDGAFRVYGKDVFRVGTDGTESYLGTVEGKS